MLCFESSCWSCATKGKINLKKELCPFSSALSHKKKTQKKPLLCMSWMLCRVRKPNVPCPKFVIFSVII